MRTCTTGRRRRRPSGRLWLGKDSAQPYDRAVEEPEEQRSREVQFSVEVPAEELGGAYANFLSVWHTAHEFTLDFGVTQPAQPTDPADPGSPIVVSCHVVSRVKIPVSVVFDVLRALNENMTRYEDAFGAIERPTRRGEEPAE